MQFWLCSLKKEQLSEWAGCGISCTVLTLGLSYCICGIESVKELSNLIGEFAQFWFTGYITPPRSINYLHKVCGWNTWTFDNHPGTTRARLPAEKAKLEREKKSGSSTVALSCFTNWPRNPCLLWTSSGMEDEFHPCLSYLSWDSFLQQKGS